MKLPRWLLIGMLATSILAVLVAAPCWWATWPQRTARDYVEAWRNGDRDQLQRLLRSGISELIDSEYVMTKEEAMDTFGITSEQADEWKSEFQKHWIQKNIRPRNRSILDYIRARQEFSIDDRDWFAVERGVVTDIGWGI